MADQLTEPRMVSWAAFWTGLGSLVTFVVAALLSLFGVPRPVLVGGVVVLGLTVASVGARVVHTSMLLGEMELTAKFRALWWFRAAVGMHCGWVLLFAARPGDWFGLLLLLAGLGMGEYGFCRAHRYLLVPSQFGGRQAEIPSRADDHTSRVFGGALQRARLDHVKVTGWEPIPSGKRFTVRLRLDETRKHAARLSTDDTEQIAIALSDIIGHDLHSDWVQVRKEPAAGTYSVTVVTEDVMAKVRPYVDDPTPTSVRTPAMVGWQLDGKPQYLLLGQHGREVGQARSGKSSLIHVKFAHITRCTDALSWVGGVEKLYDLVGPWIEPYQGTDHPLPFDWIAAGAQDVLDMLIAAMEEARWRQRQPISQRGNWPTIVIELDEASFAARNRSVTGVYQGQRVTIAQMLAMISQGAGSADVWLQRASQRSTNDHAGDQGADTDANVGYTASFRSADWAEVGRTMGNEHYKLPPPRHPGVYWLTTEDGPRLVNAPYSQETDPARPRLHDGATISDVAWARRDIRRAALDPQSPVVASEVYRRRHVRMDDALLRYLTEPTVEPEPMDPGRSGYDEAMAATAHLIAGPVEQGGGPPAVVALAERRSRADRIMDILRDSDEPLTTDQLVTVLRVCGDETAQEQVVRNALNRLVTDGVVQRPSRGLHELTVTGRDLTSNNVTT